MKRSINPRDETYAAIVEAALRLSARHGFEKTSVDGVARAAGVDGRSVYLRFSSKDELLAAVARHFCGRILRDLATAVASARAPTEKLRAFMRTSATALAAIRSTGSATRP